MNKTTIFMDAYKAALRNPNVLSETEGYVEDGKLSMRTIMHEMIRQEVQNIIYKMNFQDDDDSYDEWCDCESAYMYHDLFCWIDHGCPFDIEDEDAVKLYGFTTNCWYK